MLPTLAIEGSLNLITPIIQYLWNGTQLEDPIEAKRMAKEAFYYTIIEVQLYRRGLSQPLLKCLSLDQTFFVPEEVHERACGHDLGGKTLALKVLRVGYYWSTMTKDSVDFVKKCRKYQ